MELKEFITETISAIADATSDLQEKYHADDIVINPPAPQSGSEVFQKDSVNYTMRRVQNIDFDVAVSASSEAGKNGKAGIKVLSLELGAEVGNTTTAKQVSRVSFSIPITLKPSKDEKTNMAKRERKTAARKGKLQKLGEELS